MFAWRQFVNRVTCKSVSHHDKIVEFLCVLSWANPMALLTGLFAEQLGHWLLRSSMASSIEASLP